MQLNSIINPDLSTHSNYYTSNNSIFFHFSSNYTYTPFWIFRIFKLVQYIQKQQSEEFYPWPFTETCDGGSSLDMPDIPQCFPSACNSDEAALKAILADSMTSDEPDDESDTDSGPVCAISDFILSGLATINVSTASPTSQSSPTPPELFKASKKSKKEGEAAKKASKKAAKKAKNNKTSKKTKKVGSNGGD